MANAGAGAPIRHQIGGNGGEGAAQGLAVATEGGGEWAPAASAAMVTQRGKTIKAEGWLENSGRDRQMAVEMAVVVAVAVVAVVVV